MDIGTTRGIILKAFGERLASESRWVLWNVNEQKPKMPYSPHTGSPAEADNPSTWSGLDEALRVMSEHGRARLGIEFGITPGGFAGIDLDHVISSEGEILPKAREIVEAMNTYTELSPSGRGLHILFMLDCPLSDFSARNKSPLEGGGEFEIYDTGRYFTVTGNVYGHVRPIEARTEEARKVCAEIFKDKLSGHVEESTIEIPLNPPQILKGNPYSMSREQAREYIRENSTDYFSPDKSGRGYICPICRSGSGKKGTGITTTDGKHFTCWTGCFTHADIFEIIGLEYGISDYNGQFKKACELFRIDCEDTARKKKEAPAKHEPVQRSLTPVKDFEGFIKEACGHIEETDYHRGISLETLKAYSVGYVSSWKHPKSPKAPASPRLIIPNGNNGYLARDTRSELTDSEKGYAKLHAGKKEIWNITAMSKSAQPVYVVEGEIDALSIIDAGGMAIALCSASNANKLLEAVKDKPPEHGIILTPDNDMTGENAVLRLEEGLTGAGITFYRHEIPNPYKDANEFLMKDRIAFTEWVKEGITACKEVLSKEREQYERESVLTDLTDFLRELKTSREGLAIPTGFSSLDSLLDGGLYPGLYVVGAISALGKTTFCLQVTDQIAQAGYGVLIFSLEMSRKELIAKTLSRITRLRCGGKTENAKTTRGILKADFNPAEHELFSQAVSEYSGYAGNIHITEAIGHVGCSEIRRKVEQFMKHNEGKPPVVLIDYMQILAPSSERATDKQNVDRNVTELKRISRDYQCPLIGISSFNRENYNEPVSMASFKESGAVEYSCDVLIGLQYKGMDYIEKEPPAEHKKRIREALKGYREAVKAGGYAPIELKILKNRNGVFGAVNFHFYSMFNVFYDRGEVK